MQSLDQAVAAGRVPPHSLEAEIAVLGAVLLEQNALPRAIEILTPECFHKTAHRHVFQAAVALFERGEAVDIVTVTDQLRRMDRLEAAGGTATLSSLLASVATAAHIEHHAKIVYEKYLARCLISAAKDTIEEAYQDRTPAAELLDQAQSRIFTLNEGRAREGFVHIKS